MTRVECVVECEVELLVAVTKLLSMESRAMVERMGTRIISTTIENVHSL